MLGTRHVAQIAVAALGDEVRLGDDGCPVVPRAQLPKQRQGSGIGHRGVFDAVAAHDAGLADRRKGEDQLGARRAVDGDRPPALVGVGDAVAHGVERGQLRIVQDHLQAAAVERFVAHAVDALAQVQAAVERHGAAIVVRRRFREPGDAIACQAPRDVLDVARRSRPRPAFAQLRVGAEQPSVHGFFADFAQGGGVEKPHLSRAMLDAHRARRLQAIERLAIQQAGDGLVIAHAADPSRPRRVAQRVPKLGAGVDRRRPAGE